MWTEKPKPKPTDAAWEPIELIILKQKLAKLSSRVCKCFTVKPSHAAPVARSVHINPNDKEVQVEGQNLSSLDRFTQASEASFRKDREELTHSLTKDVLCPSCFVTMNLLRGGALKILKDEESETKHDMFSCDKATEKTVQSLEKTTSFTIKQNAMFSDLSLHGLCDSDTSLKHEVKRSAQQVKFGDFKVNSQQQTTPTVPCFCLESFMESIRPPIMNCYAY